MMSAYEISNPPIYIYTHTHTPIYTKIKLSFLIYISVIHGSDIAVMILKFNLLFIWMFYKT